MSDSTDETSTSRRNALKYGATFGVSGVLLGGLGVGATPLGDGLSNSGGRRQSSDQNQSQGKDASDSSAGGDLNSVVSTYGHYAWFPLEDPGSWGRSKSPFDSEEGDKRWLAQPTDSGGIRLLVENLPFPRNAGIDLHLGTLRSIEEISVTSRSVQTQRATSPARLFVGLYLDKNGNGEFFKWEAGDGDEETWVGFGGDEEGVAYSAAGGELVVDGDTGMHVFAADKSATLSGLKDGNVEGISGDTNVALYLGITGSGENSGAEEVVVDDVTVRRS